MSFHASFLAAHLGDLLNITLARGLFCRQLQPHGGLAGWHFHRLAHDGVCWIVRVLQQWIVRVLQQLQRRQLNLI